LLLDINLALPEVNLKANEVVSYAQTRSEFYIQHHLKGLDDTGYSFGKGSLKCRVYDKRIEIVHSNKAWFEVLWRKQGWDGVSPVTRVGVMEEIRKSGRRVQNTRKSGRR